LIEVKTMFEIPRPRLVSELWELTRRGSVMLSGAPGIGKSWLLGQLTRRCKLDSRRVITLAAEDFRVSSLQEIYDSLKFSKPLPKLLASLADAVLIIDGLDALRGDSSQRAFRELIDEVVEQAPNASIVASVRTFDLQESPALQKLLNRYAGSGRGMRKFVVGELTDAELTDAAEKNPVLLLLIVENAEPLFELLRTPFNLHIALTLLKEGIPASELTSIQSQIQLLERYWRYRIHDSYEGPLRERVLKDISEKMVAFRTLSIPETDVAEPGYQEALRGLKSAEVLRKSVTGRISYAHNILFDYAISRLLLDEYRIFDFVRADAARSLFFRPSLTFFFHRLWAYDREQFWNVTRKILSTNDIPERMRVLPAVVLSEAARTADEIDPVVLQRSLDALYAPFISLLLRAALAVHAFEGKRRVTWLNWLLKLSTHMQITWINEVLAALSVVHSNMVSSEIESVGRLSRNVLIWGVGPPEGVHERQAQNLASVATGRLLPIIADTYESDSVASEGAILEIVRRVGTPQSASNEAFWLANIMPTIIRKSPSLAEKIYLALYSQGETSEETTSMGGGVIMNFSSTRKQDFSTALYGLMSRFPLFLDQDSVRAARVAIRATESEVLRERMRDEKKEYEKSRFRLRGRLVTYQADFSEIWDRGSSRDFTSLNLLDAALEFASQAAEQTRGRMIDEICRYGSLGISWKRLMERAKLHPEVLYPEIRELLFIPKFISAPEVTVEVGEILKRAYEKKIVSESDARLIELAIVRIEGAKVVRRYENPAAIQQRLVGCLERKSIENPILLKKMERWDVAEIRENKPFYRSSFGAFSPPINDEYRRAGIDPDTPPNSAVLAAASKVREFASRYLNSVPDPVDTAVIEPSLRELHALLASEGVSAQVAESGRGTLYAAVNAIARNGTLGADSDLIQLCRAFAIEGSADPEPVFNPKYHMPFDTAGWGSPSPRIEALQALGQLIWNYFADTEIVHAFCRAATDEVPAVRYQVAAYLTSLYKRDLKAKFWETITSMMLAESTSGVMLALLHSLQGVAGLEPERTMKAVEDLTTRGLPSTDRSETRQALVNIPVGLYVVQGLDRARNALSRLAEDPATNRREISDAIFVASHYFDPKKTREGAQRSRSRDLASLLFAPARAALAQRTELNHSPEINKGFLEIIDSLASRIVFSFGLPNHGPSGDEVLNSVERAQHYIEMKPLLEQLLGAPGDPAPIPLIPRTAYYLLQLMNGILDIDPVRVLAFAAAVCEGGSYFGFELDSSARDEAVGLVDTALADHKDTLKESAVSVGRMLDLFVKAGWSEALALTFRLDDAFR
jgi:hypothetical protein